MASWGLLLYYLTSYSYFLPVTCIGTDEIIIIYYLVI